MHDSQQQQRHASLSHEYCDCVQFQGSLSSPTSYTQSWTFY